MTMPPVAIDTLTGNLLAEHTFEFEAWQRGRTQRATAAAFQVGGKGINVTRMLHRLGVPGTALCFAGGHAGDECVEWLSRKDIRFEAFRSGSPTRRGVVVRDREGAETTFLGADAAPDAAALSACAAYLDRTPASHALAVCGSFPGAGTDAFAPVLAALARWQQRAPLIVDTYGPLLQQLVALPVDLVKINRAEFSALAGAGEKVSLTGLRGRYPVRNWVVTDGPRPVRFLGEDGTLGEHSPPSVREVSPTGSGDVFLAALLRAWLIQRQPLREAVAAGLPYAAANASHPGVAEFPLPAPAANPV